MAVRPYSSGILKHKVTVETLTITRNTDGTNTLTWTADAVAWRVAIWQLRAEERVQAQQLGAEATLGVKGRYYAGLTSKHRLIFGEQILNIVSVDDIEMANVNHELRCRKVA